MTDWTVDSLARSIDHHLLNPMLDDRQMVKGLAVAVDCNCAGVCVKPYFVGMTARLLDGVGIRTGTVVGFPHGGSTTQVKIEEARRAVGDGAEEIEMVVNIGKARSCEWGYVRDEIGGVSGCVGSHGVKLRVIFETGCLSDAMIGQLCRICNEILPAGIVSSTGFEYPGVDGGDRETGNRHLSMMRNLAAAEIGVKAAGGILTLDDLLSARACGAVRFGTPAPEQILEEAAERLEREE